MTSWQPLSVRRGIRASVQLEDVPKRVQDRLVAWLEPIISPSRSYAWADAHMSRQDGMLHIAVAAGLDPLPIYMDGNAVEAIIAAGRANPLTMLDILDAALHAAKAASDKLELILQLGGSAWTVRKDGRGLEQRVDATTTEAYKVASSPADAASAELNEAWSKAYGRDPDASDAWDHAIKAVETVLVPIVTPNNRQATLGTVLAELKRNPDRLTFHLATSSQNLTNVQTLEAMLRLVWPNPDRHGGLAGAARIPSLPEAQSALQVAITVVHLVRLGTLSRNGTTRR
jgi:hypothetical protein